MNNQTILMSTVDHADLKELIQANGRRSGVLDGPALSRLAGELARARLVSPEDLSADVVTMGSVVKVRDIDTRERMQLTVSWPEDANPHEGCINVLAPLGMALLGARVGADVEWPVPAGARRLRIEAVVFQPKAVSLAGAPGAAWGDGDVA